ncbi:NADH dehydrogenase of ubiquinone 1 beta subcomplex subunit 10-B [Spatholobus suberectus]|nr:NADH dehydrogenase of ubiquinone 1 beta subcomplex subunit 10-B [Spatholobus suberectus]
MLDLRVRRTLFNSLVEILSSSLASKQLKTYLSSLVKMKRKKKYVMFEESPPDNFDPSNPMAMLEMREHIMREKWIKIQKTKIIKEKLNGATTSKASTTFRTPRPPRPQI